MKREHGLKSSKFRAGEYRFYRCDTGGLIGRVVKQKRKWVRQRLVALRDCAEHEWETILDEGDRLAYGHAWLAMMSIRLWWLRIQEDADAAGVAI